MWILFHFIFMFFCEPSSLMHFIAMLLFFMLTTVNTKKLAFQDAAPSISLIAMYIGYYLAGELYHWSYLPWWVTTICGFRKQSKFIWAGGVILGFMFHFMSWRQRIGHCVMNLGRMLKINQQSMASLGIVHAFLALVLTSVGEFKSDRLYVDVLAGISAVTCSCWSDDMSWFSIGMLFTNPLSGVLCLLHAGSPFWYQYYKNNHYKKVKYSMYYVYPILILVCLFFREEIGRIRAYAREY